MKWRVWRPKYPTLFGWHTTSFPSGRSFVLSLRWVMIRVLW